MANTYNVCNKLQAIADAITQGGGGGGGTTVIANPTGTPTADLDTVQIGQVIYDIPGSGGGGGSAYREDTIFTGSSTDTSPITLTADINYYDLLQFVVAYVEHKVTETFEIPVNYFVNNYTYSTFSDIHNTDNISLTLAGNEWFRIARGQIDTQLQFLRGGNFYLKSVIGIKLPRGAGSDEAVDINYDNTVSGLTATNVQDAIDENADSISTLNSKTWTLAGSLTVNETCIIPATAKTVIVALMDYTYKAIRDVMTMPRTMAFQQIGGTYIVISPEVYLSNARQRASIQATDATTLKVNVIDGTYADKVDIYYM